MSDLNNIKIGISACLAGEKVRFDTGHKRSNFCMDELGKHVEYVKFCPEVAVGLPVPRATIRQIRVGDTIKVARPDGTQDVGLKLTEYGKKVATSHAKLLSGFVFCAKSPSCGMERVKVYNELGTGSSSEGIGFFAEQIIKHNPLLPCEENGRLSDPHLRENFVTRIYVFKHWQEMQGNMLGIRHLTEFHARYKYLVMSHNFDAYKELGKLLGAYNHSDFNEIKKQYISGLMLALKRPASRKNQTNTMSHLQGYFKKFISKIEKEELSGAIEQYRKGIVPLFVPLTLLKHHLKVYPNEYLEKQAYFEPYPHVLKLRFGI